MITCMMNDQVVHETLDGETVVINLATGTYYSLEGSAADLWTRLADGESATESAAALAAVHGGDVTALTGAVLAFHRQLFEYALLTAPPAASAIAGGDLGSFMIPKIVAYEDLREHLLLDPVHDVERGTGWPAVPVGT
jgi:hypothetical protein